MKIVTAHEVKHRLMKYCFYERNAVAVVTEGLRNADVMSLTKERKAIEYEVKTSRSDLNRELAAIKYATYTMRGQQLAPINDSPEQAELNLELGTLKKKAGNGWSKISKHEEYIDPAAYFKAHPMMMWQSYIPNYFYLVVPRKLVEYAIEQTAGTGYGVIAYDGCRQEGQHYAWFKDGIFYNGWNDKPADAVHRKGAPCTPGRCSEEITVKKRAKLIHKEPVNDGIVMSILHRAVIENMVMLNKLIELKVDVNALHKKESELSYD